MFNLSKIFGKETSPRWEPDEVFSDPVVAEEKKAFDPELLTFNFTDQEIEKFKSKGMSDQEIELLRKTTLNKLERARFDDSK